MKTENIKQVGIVAHIDKLIEWSPDLFIVLTQSNNVMKEFTFCTSILLTLPKVLNTNLYLTILTSGLLGNV